MIHWIDVNAGISSLQIANVISLSTKALNKTLPMYIAKIETFARSLHFENVRLCVNSTSIAKLNELISLWTDENKPILSSDHKVVYNGSEQNHKSNRWLTVI